jgi:hypothetical protein
MAAVIGQLEPNDTCCLDRIVRVTALRFRNVETAQSAVAVFSASAVKR